MDEFNGKQIEISPDIFKTINLDKNNNGILDECDDCNSNRLYDLCDIDIDETLWISFSLLSNPYELPCGEICYSGGGDREGYLCGTEDDCQTSSEVTGYLTPDSCENDSDDDGVIDNCEECPDDPDKLVPGICGCGVTDTDTDGDGEPDCKDQCPDDDRFIELPCKFDCEENDQLAQIFKLDGASYDLWQTVASAAKILRNVTDNPNNGINAEFRAQELYLANWERSWSLPILSLSCATGSACVVVSNVAILTGFNLDALKLRRLVLNIVARIIANTANPTPIRRAKALRRKAKKLYRVAIAASGSVDQESALCPENSGD